MIKSKKKQTIIGKKYEDEYDDELAIYRYRNDGKPIDRYEIEEDINK